MILRYLACLILIITLLLISIIAAGGLLLLMIILMPLMPFMLPTFLIAFGAILILVGILALFALK